MGSIPDVAFNASTGKSGWHFYRSQLGQCEVERQNYVSSLFIYTTASTVFSLISTLASIRHISYVAHLHPFLASQTHAFFLLFHQNFPFHPITVSIGHRHSPVGTLGLFRLRTRSNTGLAGTSFIQLGYFIFRQNVYTYI